MKYFLITISLLFISLFTLLHQVEAQTVLPNICPTASIRDEVSRIWLQKIPALENNIKTSLTQPTNTPAPSVVPAYPNPYVLYDVEIFTNNLLEMANNCHDLQTLDQLINLFLKAYPYLITTNGSKKWVDGSGKEIILVSSQYLYLLSRSVDVITSLNPSERTATMNQFVSTYVPVLLDHYQRWIWNEKNFSVAGWGCEDKNKYNHFEYLQKLMTKSLGNKFSYCNATLDTDWWIIVGSEELLVSIMKDPSYVSLGTDQSLSNKLKEYITLGTQLIQSRTAITNLKDFNNQPVQGYTYDPGVWVQHPDYKYSGYMGADFPIPSVGPSIAPTSNSNVTWDVSHARRFVHVFNTMYRNRQLFNFSFPTDADMKLFANQLVYAVFNGDFQKPLFSNFFDGSNGWYRVNYSGRIGFGYAPWDDTITVPDGGYGFWSVYNPQIYPILKRMYEIMISTNQNDIDFRKQYYGAYYLNYIHVPLTDYSYHLLEFLPSLVDPTTLSPTESPTANPTLNPSLTSVPSCGRKKDGDATCDGIINLSDFEQWRREFLHELPSLQSDYNTDGKSDMIDFDIWRSYYFNN